MSHFTVLVVSNTFDKEEIEELLYPYWELDLTNEEMAKDPRAVFEVKCKKEDLEKEFEKCKEENEEYMNKYNYKNAEEWAEDWHGWYKVRDNYGYYHNPQAKWDWYSIGGRWNGFLNGKNQVRKKDLNLRERIEKKTLEYKEVWAKAQEHKGAKEFIYGIKEDETLNQYLKRMLERHPCQTFAVIKDGKWYQKGEMGWWAIVVNGKQECDWGCEFKALWEEIPEDAILTIVDCHI